MKEDKKNKKFNENIKVKKPVVHENKEEIWNRLQEGKKGFYE
jgi:hypothetical protein